MTTAAPRLACALALLLPHLAAAEPSGAWYAGLPVADVQLRAPEGGLPEESLDPLLQARAGEALDPADLRADIATLFQVGRFAAVEAEVEPWVIPDENGELVEAILLNYVVYPAPTIAHVRITGDHQDSKREVLEIANLGPGQIFYADLDDQDVIRALELSLYRRGYTHPKIVVTTEDLPGARLDVSLSVDDGPPNELERLAFAGNLSAVFPNGGERRLYRWARKEGVKEGQPFAPEAIPKAQQAIRTHLASMRHGLLRRRYGWVGARVTPAVLRGASGSARVTYTIEPGPRLELDVGGLDWRGDRKVQAALGIDERLRITRGWLDAAPDRLEDALRQKGWLAVQAQVSLEDVDATSQTLRVDVDKGARHYLRTGLPPGWVGIDFQGNTVLSDADLQRVVDQASSDVIRRDFFTAGELEAGLAAADDLYRARGYQDAQLELVDAEVHDRSWSPFSWLTAPVRLLTGESRRRFVEPRVVVDEGPLTTLREVTLAGVSPDVDLSAIQAQVDALAETPLSPQRLEAISRQLIEAHRAAGYLEADARVSVTPVDPLVHTAVIEVSAGPRVLLRSIVTRGVRFTRPSFVRREVQSQLTIGEPLTAPALEQVRADLYDLGTFRVVNLSLLGDEAQRDLVLDLSERARWAYELGAGLSTDLGVRTFGRLSRRNLWGRAHRFDVVGQVGLVWRSESLTDWVPDITDPTWRVAASYTAPRFPGRPQDLVVDALLRELRQERTWRMARSGGGIALENHLGDATDLRLGLRVETRQLQEVDLGALLPGEPWLALLEGGLPSRWRVQEGVTALIIHDLRNDPVAPTRGVLLSADGEWAPGLDWQADDELPVTSFLKGGARVSAYIPLGGLILRGTVEGNRGISLDGGVIPLEDRYRLGGTGSLRGYRRDAVGPHNLASSLDLDWPGALDPLIDYAVRDTPDRWAPTGGDTSALAVTELLLPLPALGLTGWEGYALALFCDVGNVWALGDAMSPTSTLPAWAPDVPLLRVGTGLGARVATPVGPLQLDFGINPQALTARGGRRALLVDGWEEPSFRAHLTLGALF